MQRRRRASRSASARWIATLLLAVIAAYLGRLHVNDSDTKLAPAPERVAGSGRPVDGDSLYVGSHEVRLQGIDAPEGRQNCRRENRDWACGDAARDQLRSLIGGDAVDCRITGRDRHGRLLGYCSANGRDLNAAMVQAGMAVAYGGYLREEGLAKAGKKGLWASEFTRPRAWRDERRTGS